MHASYYPGHEHGCGHSNSCPHIGGASLGMLVQIANTGEEQRRYLHRQLDGRDKSNSELVAQVVRLEITGDSRRFVGWWREACVFFITV